MIIRCINKLRKSERGATMVEFAIAATAFFLLFFGIIEFGWLFNGWITLNAAAREGVRLAVVEHKGNETEIKNTVKSHAPTFNLDNDNIVVTFGVMPEYKTSVKVNGNLVMPLGFFFSSPYPLEVEAHMRHER